jgi:hypothetical protein
MESKKYNSKAWVGSGVVNEGRFRELKWGASGANSKFAATWELT